MASPTKHTFLPRLLFEVWLPTYVDLIFQDWLTSSKWSSRLRTFPAACSLPTPQSIDCFATNLCDNLFTLHNSFIITLCATNRCTSWITFDKQIFCSNFFHRLGKFCVSKRGLPSLPILLRHHKFFLNYPRFNQTIRKWSKLLSLRWRYTFLPFPCCWPIFTFRKNLIMKLQPLFLVIFGG